jgi:hypothetical protein
VILTLLLTACRPPDLADSAPADPAVSFAPAEGPWTVAWDDTYGGDCALDDMSTRQSAEAAWAIELESLGFTFYDETGYPVGCDLVGTAMSCSLGTQDVSYLESGYDAVESITTGLAGTFLDAHTLDAAYSVSAECDGADCPLAGAGYGEAFEYPCTAVAGLAGTWAGE